jgi:hypothetical protein
MTALCNGGTSAPRPGYPTIVNIGAGLISVLLSRYGINAGWLGTVLSFVDIGDLTLSSFCSIDPPAIPTWNTTDSDALLGLQFGSDFDTAIGKLRDMLLHAAWYELCYCSTGQTTALPLAPAPPTGVALPIDTTVTPCVTSVTYNQRHFAADSETFIGPLVSAFSKGPTLVELITATKIETGSGFPIVFKLYEEALTTSGAFGGVVSNQTWTQNTPTLQKHTYQLDATVQAVEVSMAHTGTPTGIVDVDLVVNIYCGGAAPGGTGTAPDPATQALLRQILDLVTLIQRQGVPFGYVSGAAHTGLTGTDVIVAGPLLGVLLNVSIPARAGEQFGTPETRFDVGWLNFGTADGYTDRHRIFTDSQVIFPSKAGLYTAVGYSLEPGVTMTLTELLREP